MPGVGQDKLRRIQYRGSCRLHGIDDCVEVSMEVVHEFHAFFLSIYCCCLLLAADLVQGYEDGGVDAKAVVQEGPCDRLDSLLFLRWEKWCGRLSGGPLLCFLAVNGGCPVMRGMLWAFWGFVVELLGAFFT